jgi:hypothetical protein
VLTQEHRTNLESAYNFKGWWCRSINFYTPIQ